MSLLNFTHFRLKMFRNWITVLNILVSILVICNTLSIPRNENTQEGFRGLIADDENYPKDRECFSITINIINGTARARQRVRGRRRYGGYFGLFG